MRPRHIWGGVCAAVIGVAGAFAANAHAMTDAVTRPLDRAGFSALPSVYKMRVSVRVDQLADDRRRLAIGRTIDFEGTAFGVGPGIVVTARPLVRPSVSTLMDALAVLRIPQVARFDRNDVRVTSTTTSIVLRRGAPEPGSPTTTFRGTILQMTKAGVPSDLALLRIADPDAPALPLDESTTLDTPVVLIGFDDQPGVEPGLQEGRLGPAGRVSGSPDENLVTVSGINADRQDLGGPLIDAQGRVRGVLIRPAVASGEFAVITRAAGIGQIASHAGVELRPTRAQTSFADGLRSFWERDYSAAHESLTLAADLLPKDPWVGTLAARAESLAVADYEVVRTAPWRLPLILGAVLALAISVALAVRFWSMEE